MADVATNGAMNVSIGFLHDESGYTEDEVYFKQICEMGNGVCFVLMTVTQITTVTLFLYRSRSVREINWLPKLMICMATGTTIYYLVWTILDNL